MKTKLNDWCLIIIISRLFLEVLFLVFFIIIITKNKNNLLRRRFLCKYYIYIFLIKKTSLSMHVPSQTDYCVRLVCDENALCYFTLKNLRKSIIIIIMFCFTMLLFVEFFVCEKSTTFFLSCLFVYTLSLPPTSSKNFFKQNDFFLK